FPEQVGELVVQNAQGVRLPLHELAAVYQDVARTTISHENAQRRVVIAVDPDESVDLASFQAKAEAKVATIEVPDGVLAPVFSGDVAAAAKSTQELILHSVIAAAGILVLLAIVF